MFHKTGLIALSLFSGIGMATIHYEGLIDSAAR